MLYRKYNRRNSNLTNVMLSGLKDNAMYYQYEVRFRCTVVLHHMNKRCYNLEKLVRQRKLAMGQIVSFTSIDKRKTKNIGALSWIVNNPTMF